MLKDRSNEYTQRAVALASILLWMNLWLKMVSIDIYVLRWYYFIATYFRPTWGL